MRVNDDIVKQNHILGKNAQEMLRIRDSTPNNNLEETALKIFNETGVKVNSRDVEASHHLNQKANPKRLIVKLSRKKDVAWIVNNKKKLKSLKPQNIGLPFGCKN